MKIQIVLKFRSGSSDPSGDCVSFGRHLDFFALATWFRWKVGGKMVGELMLENFTKLLSSILHCEYSKVFYNMFKKSCSNFFLFLQSITRSVWSMVDCIFGSFSFDKISSVLISFFWIKVILLSSPIS